MVVVMPQSGKNKGNKNAVLKPGEIGRIQWTQSLSGESLQRFARHLHIDPTAMDKGQLEECIKSEARRLFEEMIDHLEAEQ